MSALPAGYDAWRTESGYELSPADEKIADRVSEVLGQHESSTARAGSIFMRALAEFDALILPLGSPCKRWDAEDIRDCLESWIAGATPDPKDEQRAWDLVRENV